MTITGIKEFDEAMKKDQALAEIAPDIKELVVKTNAIALDVSDLREVLKAGNRFLVRTGNAAGSNRFHNIAKNCLGGENYGQIKGVILCIKGDPDMCLDNARNIVEQFSERIHNDAKIIWGFYIKDELKNSVQVKSLLVL